MFEFLLEKKSTFRSCFGNNNSIILIKLSAGCERAALRQTLQVYQKKKKSREGL